MTKYQAVRAALLELGAAATPQEIARYVEQHHGLQFPDTKALVLVISMVNSKMSRKPRRGNIPPSAVQAR